MGKLDKGILAEFILSDCERQLFLRLGDGEPAWMALVRPVKQGGRKRSQYLKKMGKEYESKLYPLFHNMPGGSAHRNVRLNGAFFSGLHPIVLASPARVAILVEHEYEPPLEFKQVFFPQKPGVVTPELKSLRPDVLIIERMIPKSNEAVQELLPDGNVKDVPDRDLATRLAINIFDVKYVLEDKVGKKQFIEVMYYAWALSCFLKEQGVEDKYFVRIDGNGIIPRVEPPYSIPDTDAVRKLAIIVKPDEGLRIMKHASSTVRSLWVSAPLKVEAVPLKIKPTCGYCPYLDDCVDTLCTGGNDHPETWAVDLIPYVSPSLAQQLKEAGFLTVGDVAKRIRAFPTTSIPNPIYPEISRLELKAKGLYYNKDLYPPAGLVYSFAIPRFTPLAVTFCVEFDQGNAIAFAAGIRLSIAMPPGAPFALAFDHWCGIWGKDPASQPDLNIIKANLEGALLKEVSIEDVKRYKDAMGILKEVKVLLKDETKKDGTIAQHSQMHYHFSRINQGIDSCKEAELAKEFVLRMHSIITVCNIIENYMAVSGINPNQVMMPNTGIFYWAEEQKIHMQEMLERNLNSFINTPIWNKFSELIAWFTPSESEVSHPYQHKKLYDIQAFVESVVGFPLKINYTWHAIDERVNNKKKVSDYYWHEHFNYMDFNPWYNYLNTNPAKIAELEEKRKKIEGQILYKMGVIEGLRWKFQKDGKSVSKFAKPVTNRDYNAVRLDETYHPVSSVWYMYSKLSGAEAEWEVENFRTIYPDYSIGKLVAAKVTDLQCRDLGNNLFMHIFYLRGMSTNMKVGEEDRVLLIPEEKRDMYIGQWASEWQVTIQSIHWDSSENAYRVSTAPGKHDLLALYRDEVGQDPAQSPWYLYPTSMDAWSRKLYSGGKLPGLLERESLGTSLLGFKLAVAWEITSNPQMPGSTSGSFKAPETYMYAPFIFTKHQPLSVLPPLNTNVWPSPDASQAAAIIESLRHVVYAIQGPPGTGKTQTIAALIDEFYHRQKQAGNKPVRVLVTAFSYAAIRVIVDKLLKSRDRHGTLTRAASMMKVFLHSQYQGPVDEVSGSPRVNDLVRKSNGSWTWNGEKNKVTESKPLNRLLESDFILFSNAHQLYYLNERLDQDLEFAFDLIIVDEASQVPTDHVLASLQYVIPASIPIRWLPSGELALEGTLEDRALTKLVIVGDHNQLPPVQPVPPPKNLEKVLGSLFSYYVEHHGINYMQLETNYRSHADIVEFTNQLRLYKSLKPHARIGTETLQGNLHAVKESWVKDVLQPGKVVATIIHEREYEISVSPLECDIVKQIVLEYYRMVAPRNSTEEENFWKEKVGVVAPHNAQGRMIIHAINEEMQHVTKMPPAKLMQYLKKIVVSVEKFQGSDRNLIVASIGISDPDQIEAEREFIYDMNRFNVLTSRAKNKVIITCSQAFLDYIPHEKEIMSNVADVRRLAMVYCNSSKDLVINNEKGTTEVTTLRWHSRATVTDPLPFDYETRADGFIVTGNHASGLETLVTKMPPDVTRVLVKDTPSERAWKFSYTDIPEIRKILPLRQRVLKQYRPVVQRADEPLPSDNDGDGFQEGREEGERRQDDQDHEEQHKNSYDDLY